MVYAQDRWRGRQRFIIVSCIIGTGLCFIGFSFSRQCLPAFLGGGYYDPPFDLGPIIGRPNAKVACEWAEQNASHSKDIRLKKNPDFHLLRAWLKPETPKYGRSPEEIPPLLKKDFLMDGRILYELFYFNERQFASQSTPQGYSQHEIDDLCERVRKRDMWLKYDTSPVYEALDHYASLAIKGKRGLVIGSESPWLEAMLLEYGATSVTTIDWSIQSVKHSTLRVGNSLSLANPGVTIPHLEVYAPEDFTLDFLEGRIEPFDFAFSHSQLEHDGLGRYGDPINPFGDLHTMARLLTIVKPGGFMFLGVPCCVDSVYWNAHRVYGRVRFEEMFAGWKVLSSFPADALRSGRGKHGDWLFQPVWALQNPTGCI